MNEDTPSVTAETTLVFRAVEARKPANERICYDPIARHFLTSRSTVIGETWIPEPLIRWVYNQGCPGLQGYIVARTRYIDDFIQRCLECGLEQLVILGAGYDSRAYRFEGLNAPTTVFELDYPATQQVKMSRLSSILGQLPKHVVYVPIDFVHESLEQRLLESGYAPQAKTVFVWEGVTYYITAQAVDQTLAFVANNSGQESAIIFDYLSPSVVDGTCPRREAKMWRKAMIQRGEPLLFGVEEDTIAPFLRQRGFQQVTNIPHTFLKQAYFTGKNRHRKITPILAVAHATVTS